MTELKTEANQQFLLSDDDPTSGAYVPVVKLVRQVRRACDIDKPGGFYVEVLTYHAFHDEQPDQNTIAGYLTVILRAVADALAAGTEPADPTLDGGTISTSADEAQLTEAATRMADAAALAQAALEAEDTCESAAKWRQLLGTTRHTLDPEHVFPLPEYCNADGTTKSSRNVTRGAPAVPAGNDRYA